MDRVIDDVARAMTGGNPPADLRGAVLARLDRRLPWRWAWLALPATVAAIVVLTVAVRDRGATVPSTPVSSVAQVRSAPAVDPPAAAAAGPAPRRVSSRRARPGIAAIRSIAALAEPRPLRTEIIQPDALAIPLLQMKPIATEPIAIKAIDDGSGGR